MVNKNKNNNSSNSLVFGRWPQTKMRSHATGGEASLICMGRAIPFRSLWCSTSGILLVLQDLPGLSRGLLQPVHQRAHGGPQLNYWTRNGHQLGWPLSLVIPVSRLRKVSLSAWLVTGLGLFWDSLWLWASPVCTLAVDPHTPSSFTSGFFTSLWRI